jgi:uncharacterized protein involved in outer membrane biogenesis
MRFSFWGGPYLIIKDMTVMEDLAFGEGNFLKASDVRADFSVLKYVFSQQIVIDALTIESADFTLIKNKDGVWNWTTVGEAVAPARRAALNFNINAVAALFASSSATLNQVDIKTATVRMIDKTGAEPPESFYKNISLVATMTAAEGQARRATGEVNADSVKDQEAEAFKARLPFDFTYDTSKPEGMVIDGTLGPGPLQTENISMQQFQLTGKIHSKRPARQKNVSTASSAGGLTGQGHLSITGLHMASVNVSENVAGRLQISNIGNMQPGTDMARLETDYHIDQGIVTTNGLRIEGLDGLGEATAPQGWFKVERALVLNYKVDLLLSPETTAQMKASYPMAEWLSIFQNSDRFGVSVNVTGSLRNPQIQVDVLRTLGF